MQAEIAVAVVSFLGTFIGTVGGIIASAKLTNYRILQLEKKVEKHNSFAERIPVIEEKIKLQTTRISNLERNEMY